MGFYGVLMNEAETFEKEQQNFNAICESLKTLDESGIILEIDRSAVKEKLKKFGKAVVNVIKTIAKKIADFFVFIGKKLKEFFQKLFGIKSKLPKEELDKKTKVKDVKPIELKEDGDSTTIEHVEAEIVEISVCNYIDKVKEQDEKDLNTCDKLNKKSKDIVAKAEEIQKKIENESFDTEKVSGDVVDKDDIEEMRLGFENSFSGIANSFKNQCDNLVKTQRALEKMRKETQENIKKRHEEMNEMLKEMQQNMEKMSVDTEEEHVNPAIEALNRDIEDLFKESWF